MAVLRDFCSAFKSPTSRSSQSSPSLSNPLRKPRVQFNKQRFLSHEAKGSRVFRTFSKSEHFGILHEDPKPPVDFPRYTPLPAIGKSQEEPLLSVDLSKKPKLIRQLSYTVINPVYVKESVDNPKQAGVHMQPLSEMRTILQKSPWKKKKVLPNTDKSQEDLAKNKNKELGGRKRKVHERFSEVHHGSCIKVNQELLESFNQIQIKDEQKVEGAFWVQW